VPKAALDEDGRGRLSKHEVGLAGQRFGVNPVSKAGVMEKLTQSHLRARVAAPDLSHIPPPAVFANRVGHTVGTQSCENQG